MSLLRSPPSGRSSHRPSKLLPHLHRLLRQRTGDDQPKDVWLPLTLLELLHKALRHHRNPRSRSNRIEEPQGRKSRAGTASLLHYHRILSNNHRRITSIPNVAATMAIIIITTTGNILDHRRIMCLNDRRAGMRTQQRPSPNPLVLMYKRRGYITTSQTRTK